MCQVHIYSSLGPVHRSRSLSLRSVCVSECGCAREYVFMCVRACVRVCVVSYKLAKPFSLTVLECICK